MLHLKRIDAGAFTGLTNLTKFNCSHNPLMTSIDPKTFSWIENDEIVYPPIKEVIINSYLLHSNSLKISILTQ